MNVQEQQQERYADMVNQGIMPATLISMVPWRIRENKQGIFPGLFDIPAAKRDSFESLVIGPSVQWIYIDIHRGSTPRTDMPYKIAQAVVRDYRDATLLAGAEAYPGFFAVPGGYEDPDEIIKKFENQLAENHEAQLSWFRKMIEVADDEWQKFHLHRLITDSQRAAAKYLGLKREWMVDYTASNSISCPACGTTVMSSAAVCYACRNILNPEVYATLKFADGGSRGVDVLGGISGNQSNSDPDSE